MTKHIHYWVPQSSLKVWSDKLVVCRVCCRCSKEEFKDFTKDNTVADIIKWYICETGETEDEPT